jgi:tRNA nucleotidyltransferase (CCA-adding enzyme)
VINKDIKIELPKWVKYIIDTLNEFEYEAYVVGGCVRDSLLKREPKDWDITTNAKPEVVIEIFESLGFKVIPTGIKHGTVTIMINNIGFEVTTYRIDGEYSDSRRPDKVEFTSDLKEDLSRRDFTINAMAYNDKVGLVDYFGGVEDLSNKIIRCVGNPQDRYQEDGLRMLRGLRFSAQLGFRLHSQSYYIISDLKHLVGNISLERIRDEFGKILITSNTRKAMCDLWYLGLLYRIMPELDDCAFVEQNNPYHCEDVFGHILSVVENIKSNEALRLSALFHDICKPQCKTTDEEGIDHFYNHAEESSLKAEEILKRMKYDNKTIEKVKTLVKYHDREITGSKSIRKLLNLIGEENFRDLLKVKEADIKAQNSKYYDERIEKLIEIENKVNKIIDAKECFSIKDLAINGRDLMELGIKQGKEIGNILNKSFELVLDNPNLNDKEYLLNIVKNNL